MSVSQRQSAGVPFGPVEYVDTLVTKGTRAESDIAETPSHIRSGWLEKAAAGISESRESLARNIVEEGIKTIREARSEVDRAAFTLKLCAEEAKRVHGDTFPFDQSPSGVGRIGWWDRRPVGLVAAITPFNDPLNLVAHKVGPALAAGCPIIVKPHENTPGPAIRLHEILTENGMADDYFQVCEDTSADYGQVMVEHPGVRKLTFTGGKATGTAIARAAAGRPVSLELGGICSTIVLEDIDTDSVSQKLVSGMFAAAGQNCLHVQRLLIDAAVHSAVLDRIIQLASRIRLGDPMSEETDMGDLISEEAAQRCESMVADAVDRGGQLALGGTRSDTRFQPTILTDTPEDARIFHEEIFGPVTVVERIDGLDDAIDRVSRMEASLATAIFTGRLEAPFRLRKLRTGAIIVNDSTDFRIDAMPFGGPFPAGLSREGVQHAIQSMTEPQLVCLSFN